MTRLRPAVIVHYHELSLKRGNRPLFLRHLAGNLSAATAGLGPITLQQLSGRILLDLAGNPEPEAVRDRVARVFGVASCALAYRVPSTLDAMKALIQCSAKIESPKMLGHLFTTWVGKIDAVAEYKPMVEGMKVLKGMEK